MKIKHNKKRNTAFLFESLIRELTKSIVHADSNRATLTQNILKEHFGRGMVLFSELDCFNSLVDSTGLDQYTAEKTMFRARAAHKELDQDDIFREQSRVIKKVNTQLGKEVFNNFVPNYKSYATLAQIFGDKAPLKSKVLMERQILKQMTQSDSDSLPSMEPVDSLVVNQFSASYNNKYTELLPEQQDLLSKYIVSFGAGDADFRFFLSEELKRIQAAISNSLSLQEVQDDATMVENTNKVLNQLKELNVSQMSEEEILKVLKLQKLVHEYNSNDDNT